MPGKGITPVQWQKFEKFLLECGCIFVHQKGSHRVYTRPDLLRPIIVPVHVGTDLPPFVIRNNLRTLGCNEEAYMTFMQKTKKKRR